ncbi:MAG: hypothetical protein FAZ92_02111 [Accumulibacter sp.]|nr:MAG: hypothetical protein FAZ92_02111 [Accumulibacter sp.]
MRAAAHHRGHLGRHSPQFADILAGDAEDDREADRRAVLEAQHARSQAAPFAAFVGETLLEATPQILACGDVVRRDDELCKAVVEQLLVERQVEARAAVADIAGVIADRTGHLRRGEEFLDAPGAGLGCLQR